VTCGFDLRMEGFHQTPLSEISGSISSFAWTAVTGSWCYSIISTFQPWCLPLMLLKSVDDSLHLEPINKVWQKGTMCGRYVCTKGYNGFETGL
jgi:hypothetical protein